MKPKYACPGCGTPLGYDGLCWKCKSEQERTAVLAWALDVLPCHAGRWEINGDTAGAGVKSPALAQEPLCGPIHLLEWHERIFH